MKKSFLYIAAFAAQLCAASTFAQDNNPNLDLEYQDVYRDYIEQKNLSDLSTKLTTGDTLHITSNYCVAEYVLPDTIWKKHVKKPKENKHYILQYIWKGTPTTEKSKFGFPVYVQSTYKIDGNYLYEGFENSDDGKRWLIVTDPTNSRAIKFSTKNLKLAVPKMTRAINKRMTSDSIYYVMGQRKNEEDYNSLKIESVDYAIVISDNHYSGNVSLKVPGKVVSFKNGKLDLVYRTIISKNEYDEFFEKTNKDKKFLSLVVVKGCIPEGKEYYFKADTMALYRMGKDKKYSWDDDEQTVYYCYAYGQSYTFKLDSWDTICMLSPNDSTYLLSQKTNGENYRLENAKKWDEKNAWLVARDEKWDKDTCILATLEWETSVQTVDKDGNRTYDSSVEMPKKGAVVPVICYGDEGDYLAAYRILYKGKLFAVDWRGLRFKSEDECSYLMRRGQQGYYDRLIKALAHTLAEALIAELEMSANYDKKQIFYLGNEIYDSGYGWDGVKIKFYNCYKKTIKYINCTLTAYNYFGDVQAGYSGRTTSDIRCIGPIEHGDGGAFSFDDIMNNKNGIIKSYRPTKITITFVDNTTITFNGWSKIKPHSDY